MQDAEVCWQLETSDRSHGMDEKKGEISLTPPQAPHTSARSLKWMLHYSVTMGWIPPHAPPTTAHTRLHLALAWIRVAACFSTTTPLLHPDFPLRALPPSAESLLHWSVWQMVRRQYRPCHKFFGSHLRRNSPWSQTFLPRREMKTHLVAGQNWHSVLPPLLLIQTSALLIVEKRWQTSFATSNVVHRETHILRQIARLFTSDDNNIFLERSAVRIVSKCLDPGAPLGHCAWAYRTTPRWFIHALIQDPWSLSTRLQRWVHSAWAMLLNSVGNFNIKHWPSPPFPA